MSTTSTTTTSATADDSSSGNSLTVAVPAAVIFFLVVVILYQFKDMIGASFETVVWVTVLVLPYLIAVGIHLIQQQTTCGNVDAGKAFKGAVATEIAMVVSMGIASLSWFRIPVASVFAPFLMPSSQKDTEVTLTGASTAPSRTANATVGGGGRRMKGGAATATACCGPTLSLEDAEQQYPLLIGLTRGFYIFFGSLFGIVIGNSISAVC